MAYLIRGSLYDPVANMLDDVANPLGVLLYRIRPMYNYAFASVGSPGRRHSDLTTAYVI